MKKHAADRGRLAEIHQILGFDGVIMTDSGAYQILSHGSVDISPRETVQFQERIGSDIGVILDIPTSSNATRVEACKSVRETLKRAREVQNTITASKALWVGPVQGGTYLDLVEHSAKKMARLTFDIYAIGSPTTVLMAYNYQTLVDMIVTAKRQLPLDKPVHLFGAGHPMMFSLAVALGCDMFDSASYGLFARGGRYLTVEGTFRLNELESFPCPCRICETHSPSEMRRMDPRDREKALATHNLLVCIAEIRAIKQAAREGLLWEHLRVRCQAHPALWQAFKSLSRHASWIERFDPVTKPSVHGLLYTSEEDLRHPKVLRHHQRMKGYAVPTGCRTLCLLPSTGAYHAGMLRRVLRVLGGKLRLRWDDVHVCLYEWPYGVVPLELVEVFPLSQFEKCDTIPSGVAEAVVLQAANYIKERANSYGRVVVVYDEKWGDQFVKPLLRSIARLKLDMEALSLFPARDPLMCKKHILGKPMTVKHRSRRVALRHQI